MEMAAAVDQCKGWPPFFLLLHLIFNQPLPMALNHKRMKTNPNDGAHPIISPKVQNTFGQTYEYESIGGLTKREHFAALAMQGWISADFTANSGIPHQGLAEWSVDMADALIEALNKEG